MEEKNLPPEIVNRRKGLVKPSDGKTLMVNGCEIFYREKGKEPVLLYIHGNLGCHSWFDDVMDVPGYWTIAPDMPNFGFSGRIESCEIESYADYMIGFLETLAGGPAVVAGHSLGGVVAQSMAVKRPDLVKKLVLIDSGSVKGLHTPEASYPVIEQYKVNYGLLGQALSYIMPGLKDENRKRGLIDMALLMSHHCYIGHARTLDNFDMTAEAEKLNLPVLVMRGAGDLLITQEMADETAKAWKGRLHLFANSGHSPLVEVPGEFLATLKDFLNLWRN